MDKKQDKKSKRKKLKKFYILILILFLFLLGGIVVQHQSGTKSKLHRKIEELRAAGYPVTLKELDDSYYIPSGVENAADFILDAISYYIDTNDSRILKITDWKTLSPEGEPLPDDIRKHAVSYLRDNQKSLELLHKAAALKYCRYPVNLGAGQKLKIVDLQQMVRLLCVEAAVHAENGDIEASVKSLICSLNIADSLFNSDKLFFFTFDPGKLIASATTSAISATRTEATEAKVFLHNGQAVARISGLFRVRLFAASVAIRRLS